MTIVEEVKDSSPRLLRFIDNLFFASHPCLSVSICVQVVKARINKGFLDAMDGHCQWNCQHGGGLKHNPPLSGQNSVETRPLHPNVSRQNWCMIQTHAHENKIHPVPARRNLL